MRIPKRKLYRAFPELDQECERYVRQVKAQRAVRSEPVAAVLALSVCVGIVANLFILPRLHRGVAWWRRLETATFELADVLVLNAADLARLMILGMFLIAIPAALAGLTRDWILRRALRERINRAGCPSCKQSLLGLPISDAESRPWVRCPECGERHDLAEMSLAPADLIPRELSMTSEPR